MSRRTIPRRSGENNADVHLGVSSRRQVVRRRWLEVGDTRNDTHLIGRAGLDARFSRSVYVVRMNRVQNRFGDYFRSGGGRSNTVPSAILREADPYWINLAGDVKFLRGRQAISVDQREGRLPAHLSLIRMTGKSRQQVTQGRWGS